MQQFHLKTDIKFGPGALDFLGEIRGEKVFIVTDPFMVESKMIDQITSHLGGGSFLVFSEIVPDPPVEVVTRGMAALLEYQPQVVLAFGGGSAIDSAKAILFFSQKSGKMGPARFIAVPTTSGTGSEATAFAVITDKDKGTKYPLVSDDMVPDIAILDASLVKTLPSSVVADTGMDVITHAIEAYVSTCATDFSDAFAEKAVAMAFSYLPSSFQNREDGEAKEKMHTASCLAGISFQLASLGLNHAIAHNVGARLHIPHGVPTPCCCPMSSSSRPAWR